MPLKASLTNAPIAWVVWTIKNSKWAFLGLTLIWVSSCTPTKAYLGPELPDEELAKVRFSADYGVTLKNMVLEGIGVGIFDWGARVMPGRRSFSLTLSYDLSECDSDYRRDDVCVPFTHRFRCAGEFNAVAGESYRIQVGMGSAWVIEEDTYRFVGRGECH